jgi:hypothetical protein
MCTGSSVPIQEVQLMTCCKPDIAANYKRSLVYKLAISNAVTASGVVSQSAVLTFESIQHTDTYAPVDVKLISLNAFTSRSHFN